MSTGGDEYVLRSGDYTAIITQVGAGIRRLRHGKRDLILDYPAEQVRPRFRGALVAPWPNRIADGRYSFGGEELQLSLNEPERNTALHGLISWVRFDVVEQNESAVTLRHRLVPQQGYPFQVELSARYSLRASGLTCAVTAHNVGGQPAPYGTAPHPYLRPGDGGVDDWALRLPAEEVLQVTPDRLLPTGRAPVADVGMDFRSRRRLEGAQIDHAFTRLTPDPDGLVRARLTHDERIGVECEWDPGVLPWVQVHTADLPDPAQSRRGLALEPMTCPPDAFNSGEDVVILEPGGEHTAWWTLRVCAP